MATRTGRSNISTTRAASGSATTLRVYAFGLEEYGYSASGSPSSQAHYYSLGGHLLGTFDGTNTSFYLTDGLGSVVATFSNTANSAAVQGNATYEPYGKPQYQQGNLGTSVGYTGQYSDNLSGLDYYGARYYDPIAGLFLTPDSVQGNVQGMDPYAYVAGNPETLTDPTGHGPCDDDLQCSVGKVIKEASNAAKAGISLIISIASLIGAIGAAISQAIKDGPADKSRCHRDGCAEMPGRKAAPEQENPTRSSSSADLAGAVAAAAIDGTGEATAIAAGVQAVLDGATPGAAAQAGDSGSGSGGSGGPPRKPPTNITPPPPEGGECGNNAEINSQFPGDYLSQKAPMLSPGTKTMRGVYVNNLGLAEPWLAQYDAFGRMIGRTDIALGDSSQGIESIHYHMYAYDGTDGDLIKDPASAWPIKGVQSLDHISGIYDPFNDSGAHLCPE